MDTRNSYYFVSDIHLGLNYKDPRAREIKFARFLESIPKKETSAVFLLGDIFDFWYEYKDVIPVGYTRVLGAIASLVDNGVKVFFFNGNHDIWTYKYLQKELGVEILKQPYVVELDGKRFCLGHGDGLGEGDFGYKILNSIFKCRILQILFSAIHPRWAFMFAHKWSKHNRLTKNKPYIFKGKDETIVKFCEQFQSRQNPNSKIDYFIFGHFHCKASYDLSNGGNLRILSEWINDSDYLYFNGESLIERHFTC